jgi:transposase
MGIVNKRIKAERTASKVPTNEESNQIERDSRELNEKSFKSAFGRESVYDEIQKAGIEAGLYRVMLKSINTGKTTKGIPVVRFTYMMLDAYEFEGQSVEKVHFTASSSDEHNAKYDTNFAWQTLAQLMTVLDIDDTELESIGMNAITTNDIIRVINRQLDEVDNEFKVQLRTTKQVSTQNPNEYVPFYTVYIRK